MRRLSAGAADAAIVVHRRLPFVVETAAAQRPDHLSLAQQNSKKANTQIRLYPTEQRKALEQVDDPAWTEALAKYLADLECPLIAGGGGGGGGEGARGEGGGGGEPQSRGRQQAAAALRWLVALALSLDYRDSAAELNAAGAEMEQEAQREEEAAAARVAEAAAQAERGGSEGGAAAGAAAAAARRRLAHARQATAFPDMDAPQVRAEIEKLVAMLRPADGDEEEQRRQQERQQQGEGAEAGAAEAAAAAAAAASSDPAAQLERRLAAARRAVAEEIIPTVGASGLAASSASHAPVPPLSEVPLGFSTGCGARVDRAAALLRVLYLRDLRALQGAVDAAVVEAQEYTANPRTDSSLGRVGR